MIISKIQSVVTVFVITGISFGGIGLFRGVDIHAQHKSTPAAERPPNGPMARPQLKDGEDLQGDWVVLEWEEEGTAADSAGLKGKKFVIKGKEIAGQFGLTGKMSFRLDAGKSPKEIDLTALDGWLKGTTQPGIYAVDGPRLRICYGVKVRPKKFETTPVSGLVLISLEKENSATSGPKDKGPEHRKGKVEAGRDIAAGILKYKWYGQPDATEKLLGQILKADYGITLDIVAGCKVPEDVRQRVDGYNAVILDHMANKGQKDFLTTADHKARKQWDRLTPEERAHLFTAVPYFERTVSLTADKTSLRDALTKIALDADLGIEFDSDALAKAGLDLDRPVSARIENVPLARAIGYLIDWNSYPNLLREVRHGNLVFTSLEGWQARTAGKLPTWMTPLYNKGLLATLDDNDDVATVTAGTIVTDDLLAKIRSLPNLRELHIEATKGITAAGLSHLRQMPRLEKLSLYQVNADGTVLGDDAIRGVAGSMSLRELWIGECGITDAGVKALQKLPNLTTLTLRHESRLTDAALESIARLSRLKSLSLPSYVGTRLGWLRYSVDGTRQSKELVDNSPPKEWMRFSAEGIRQLNVLKELESLHLVGHDVHADALAFPKLKSLAIGYPGPDDPRDLGWCGIGDDVAKKIGELRNLRNLELGYSAIGDNGLKSVAGLPELRRLTIRSEIITDAGIRHFQDHKQLEHVTLRVSGATDLGLRHLAQIQTLTRLDLDGSGPRGAAPGRQFSMAGLQQLKILPRLDTLWLTNFDIPGGGFDGLKELRHLRELTLRKTNITKAERDTLAKALPNTRLSALTGGGNFYPAIPKRNR